LISGPSVCEISFFVFWKNTVRRINTVKRLSRVLTVILLFAFVVNGVGCSKLFAPSDEDVLKAINESGLLKSDGFTVTAPIVILEKGKKKEDGGWPVTVRLKLSVKMANGQTKDLETKPSFRIYKSKDSAGKTIWTAKLGS
jgi:hypothetical protein